MKINDELIKQWEPKIQKMLSNTYIIGMDREDIAQELRIAIIKAAKSFDDSRGIIFHTYLHTTLLNTIRTLMSKVGRQPEIESLDEVHEDTNMIDSKLLDALKDPANHEELIHAMDLLTNHNLTKNEKEFVFLRLDGLTMEEISVNLAMSAYKVRQSLREKFVDLANEHQIDF